MSKRTLIFIILWVTACFMVTEVMNHLRYTHVVNHLEALR